MFAAFMECSVAEPLAKKQCGRTGRGARDEPFSTLGRPHSRRRNHFDNNTFTRPEDVENSQTGDKGIGEYENTPTLGNDVGEG